MNDQKLYQQKRQAQLDEWAAQIDNLKAKLSGRSAEVQLQLNKKIQALEEMAEQGRTKLDDMAAASEETWESIKDRVDSAWDRLKSALHDLETEWNE